MGKVKERVVFHLIQPNKAATQTVDGEEKATDLGLVVAGDGGGAGSAGLVSTARIRAGGFEARIKQVTKRGDNTRMQKVRKILVGDVVM